MIEGNGMCDYFYESDNILEIAAYPEYNLTRQQCKTIGNGIALQGMRNFI